MPALLPGYECDVFISYRQKDNKGDHWVTEFVESLRTELDSIFKEDVSIYFDCNPTDGLLETHDVHSSLEKKLKCLVFIPIVSQTYCDPKAFAWEHEFQAFKKNASQDELGLKVKLPNGNIASRILPVCIHDLDADDKHLLESELGGAIRGVEFIYRSAGVVRPLKSNEEDHKANINHTFYRDQINKVARAIKDLINGIQAPTRPQKQISIVRSADNIRPSSRRKISWLAAAAFLLGLVSFGYYYLGGLGEKLANATDKSIAVLPFVNLSNDPEQEYFSDGISEDILNHLTKIADLKVKSRTSTLQYKGTQKASSEIGDELAVGNIVEGTVRRVGDKIRVAVQLVDTKTDVRLWSESYDREVKDVLALQSEIAIEIANALEARLTATERQNIQKESSKSALAYDYFLRAREGRFWFNGSKAELETILQMVDRAIRIDPNFSQAYALKARVWYNFRTFGVKQTLWEDSALYYSAKAIAEDPTSPDGYLVQSNVYRYLGKVKESEAAEVRAYNLAPNNPDALRAYGMQLLRYRDEHGADMVLEGITKQYSTKDPEYYVALAGPFFNLGEFDIQNKLITKAISMGDVSFRPLLVQTTFYWFSKQYAKGLVSGKAAEKLIPESTQIIDDLGWLYYLTGDYENAAKYWSKYKEIEARFEDSTQTVAFRHRLAMVYLKTGRKKEADALFREDLTICQEQLAGKRSTGAWYMNGAIFYEMAVDHAYFGNLELAVQCLDSALHRQHTWDWGYNNDPMLEPLRARADFQRLMQRITADKQFRKIAFANALNRLEASGELKNILK